VGAKDLRIQRLGILAGAIFTDFKAQGMNEVQGKADNLIFILYFTPP
jgi:hypothetical protein